MTWKKRFACVALAAALGACGDDDGTTDVDMTTGMDMQTGEDMQSGEDMGMAGETVMVDADITADTTWTTGNTYILASTIYVVGAELVIEEGVTVQGAAGQNALVVTTTGTIDARGTASNPVVFTSGKDEGLRAPGDWGGLVLLGSAPINVEGGTNNIEGLDPGESRGTYGGDDATHNCGSLRYVRIEWAGFLFGEDNELNGLTLGGCGSDTTLEYIQVHGGLDDGIEFFGGTANLRYAVVSAVGDDTLDTDQGYSGNVQFFVSIKDARGDNGIEADNLEDAEDSMPRSTPNFWNVTFIGIPGLEVEGDGIRLRHGTAGVVGNAIVQDFDEGDCLQIDGDVSVGQANDGAINVQGLICHNTKNEGVRFTPDTDGFEVTADFSATTRIIDPMIGSTNLATPNFVPAAESPAASGAAANPGGFFMAADYLGAFEPGGTDWSAGWTAYPAIAE